MTVQTREDVLAPTTIDLSKVPFPDVIEALDFEVIFGSYAERFVSFWNEARLTNPNLPAYTVEGLETDPGMVAGQAFSYSRILDRQRVNDAVKAVLAQFAKNDDLDNVVLRQNVFRLDGEPDERLLLRYLLSFDRASAGSPARLLYEAYTAWPGLYHASVVGRATHGRLGDTEVIIAGAGGVVPTKEERALVQTALQTDGVKPEAMGLYLLDAEPLTFSVFMTLTVPNGPDKLVLQSEASARVVQAALARQKIGASVPASYLQAAAYQDPNVLNVVIDSGFEGVFPTPYQIPILTDLSVNFSEL